MARVFAICFRASTSASMFNQKKIYDFLSFLTHFIEYFGPDFMRVIMICRANRWVSLDSYLSVHNNKFNSIERNCKNAMGNSIGNVSLAAFSASNARQQQRSCRHKKDDYRRRKRSTDERHNSLAAAEEILHDAKKSCSMYDLMREGTPVGSNRVIACKLCGHLIIASVLGQFARETSNLTVLK